MDEPNAPQSQSAAGSPSGDPEEQDLVPYKEIEQYGEHPIVKRIMEAASSAAASTGAPVSTSFLLFAIADSGNVERQSIWAGDFLAQTFLRTGSRLAEVRERHRSRKVGRSERASKQAARQSSAHTASRNLQATRHAYEACVTAAKIAQETAGVRLVHTRHLLAALLRESPDGEEFGSLLRLREMGLDPAEVRDAFLGFLIGYGDKDDAWERWLSVQSLAVARLLSFSADNIGAEDLIGIGREVTALATLVAARQVTPPLSIGLFGEWGSGKTFFMRKLQKEVTRLATDARKGKSMQRDTPFYKCIVQIEFNAWHYVEGNLWASLVEHIFDNLRVSGQEDESVTERLQKKLLDELKFREASKEEASTQEERARAQVVIAEKALTAAEKERDDKRAELAQLKTENILAQFPLPALQQQLQPLLAALNLGQVGDAAGELGHALHRAEAVLREGGNVLGPLLHAQDRVQRWIRLGAVLLLPPLVALAVAALLRWEGIPRIGTFMTGLAGALTLVARWIKEQSEWAQSRLARVHEIQAQYDRDVKAALARNENKIAAAQHTLEQLSSELEAARRRREAAEQAHEEAKRQLAAASGVRLLANFIQDRAASTDYRQHLGLLALVRDDFERLSGLIEDENWRLNPLVEGEKGRKKLTKFESFEEEMREIDSRINRIVLYIDDLDRCPPSKVVEVLQAVHLLLAFPLFVVVVGVDARWIKRSLRTRYRRLLHTDETGTTSDGELIGRATANDYLEKIFHIPFWIDAMDEDDCKRMVHGLLRGSIVNANGAAKEGTKKSVPEGPEGGADADDGKGSGEVRETNVGNIGASGEQLHDVDEHPPNLESLEIRQEEVDAMNQLAPLLGRSPRALKRFINVYRLVKAGLSPIEYRKFIENGMYREVLFLLAVDSGMSAAAPAVFRALARLRTEPQDNASVSDLLEQAVNLADRPPTAAEVSDGERLRAWLSSENTTPFLNDVNRLSAWASRIARYSFGAEAADALRFPQAKPGRGRRQTTA
jgi:KAP family P-loop domain